jgi:hypothetical protein
MSDNTISSIVRGFPTQTRSLGLIAEFLKVPIEAVLVSPLQRLTAETQRQLMREALDNALRSVKAGQPLDEDTIAWANQLRALRGEFRKTATTAIQNMREAQKLAFSKRRGSRPSPRR